MLSHLQQLHSRQSKMIQSSSAWRLINCHSWEMKSLSYPICQENLTCSSASSSSSSITETSSLSESDENNLLWNNPIKKEKMQAQARPCNLTQKSILWELTHSFLLMFRIDRLLDYTLNFFNVAVITNSYLPNWFLCQKIFGQISTRHEFIPWTHLMIKDQLSSFASKSLLSQDQDASNSNEQEDNVESKEFNESIREHINSDPDIAFSSSTIIPAADEHEADDEWGHFTDFAEPQTSSNDDWTSNFCQQPISFSTLETIDEDES